jgi:hypothetical protein
LGKAYGLNTQVLLVNLQHFCNNNIIILNYYYFIPGLFPSHSWWAESCSVRLSRGMVCSRQPRSFQGVHPHGRPDGFRGSFISSRRPLIAKAQVCVCQGGEAKQASKTKSSELVFFGVQQGLFSLSPQPTTTTRQLSPFDA